MKATALLKILKTAFSRPAEPQQWNAVDSQITVLNQSFFAGSCCGRGQNTLGSSPTLISFEKKKLAVGSEPSGLSEQNSKRASSFSLLPFAQGVAQFR